MEKEFSSISELAKALKEGVERMEQGGLSVRDLEMLTREAAELHERLIILRYKAYDTIVKPENTDVSVSENNPIRITVPENQINLIDAIEEVEGGGETEEEQEEQEGTPFRLDFGTEEEIAEESEEQEEETEQEEAIEEEIEKEVEEVESVVEEEEPIAQKEEKEEPNLNVIEGAEEEYIDNSLAEKLRKSPIQDLRKSIGLNQKFQFISDLFDGDNQSYDALIESLNTAQSLDQAMNDLESEQEKHEWEIEGKTFLKLKELVERRHS